MAIQHDFKDLAVLITGAGRGLGRSVAARLASCGATVGLVDIDAAGCEAAAARIRDTGGRALAYATDVANRSAFSETASRFAAERGRIDAVVNNAMLLRYEPIEKVTEDVLQRMLGVGINGSIWGVQALLTHMDAARGGAIVTLTKTLAAELGPRGVRVNAVAPGSVPTPGAMGLNDEAEYARRARTIPLRRLGHEDDNAEAVAWLLSPEAAFINGEILHVDGGIAAAG